ncbi:MAG: hypothetical protein Crog4KO_20850 [Crocinitomicaceae bacterium]
MIRSTLVALLFLFLSCVVWASGGGLLINMSGANDHDRALIKSSASEYENTSDVLKRAQIILDLSDSIQGYTIKRRLLQVNVQELRRLISGMNPERLNKRNALLARSYLGNAEILLSTGTGDLGREYLFDAKQIADSHPDDQLKLEVNAAISTLYHRQGQIEESLKYFEISHKLCLKVGDSSEACTHLNNMGVLQSEMGKNLQSLETLKDALAMAVDLNDKYLQGMCRNNLGGTLGHLERHDEAMDQLQRSLELFRSINNTEWEAYTLAKLARVMRNAKSPEKQKILDYGLRALHIGDSLQQKDIQRRALRILHVAYKDLGQYEQAYQSYQQYQKVRSDLRGERRKIAMVQREAKYEIEKQLALERSKSEQKIALAQANESKQEIIAIGSIIGCILLLAIIVLVFQRLRVVKRQKRLIEQQNDERKLLLKEIHHRIKNNFQVVSSLLRLQASEENNEKIARAFDDAVLRIQSMASVHELIYKQEMFEALDFRSYLDRLLTSIQSYTTETNVSISAETNVEKLNIKTLVPLGITINELVTNSLKYAFKEESIRAPEIKLEIVENGAKAFKMMYRDNGSGFLKERKEQSFGIELIETVIEQVDGTIEQSSTPDWKNTLEIHFKEIN